MSGADGARVIAVEAADGHRYELLARIPAQPRRSLLWLPALGIAARHYLPFAEALAARGIAVFIHEWRGHGSSSLRASRAVDWGYRELLERDIPASEAVIDATLPGLPRVAGGHSLGGQLACCRLALAPASAGTLWLVGSGAPWWRAFRLRERMWLPLAYRFLPWLADRAGALPGRHIGFGGNEARGLLRDWAATAISGRYAAIGLGDLEPRMAAVDVQVRAALLERDWLAPASSLQYLLSRLPRAQAEVTVLSASALGVPADHFAWMKSPHAVAAWLGS
ncbi:alpha/beta fold hydrolase [Luteimonas sp. MC1828]|uniref:alpha/beta hydrolase family protein n=1 Tax=Luteimonas sp. MC1828 TaxID=2799787 RepID=UPI0031BA8F8D